MDWLGRIVGDQSRLRLDLFFSEIKSRIGFDVGVSRPVSSWRLEKETQRNSELMWRVGRLTPDFKTIANFRKDNGKAIQNICRLFIVLCQQ